MTRLARGVGSLLLLLCLVVGVPLLLLQVGRVDPSVLGRLLQPDDGALVASAATVVGWALWLALVVEIVTDLIHQVSHGGISWRPRATSWARPMTSVLVAAVLAMTTVRTHAAAVEPLPEPSGISQSAITQTIAPVVAAVAAEESVTVGHDIHRIEPGEDLWTVAERYLGDGSRWRELADLNPDARQQAPAVGSPILLPAGAVLPVDDADGTSRVVTVKPGDSLWRIAAKHLGDGERWPEIAAANQALVDNPHEIEIGWRLLIPADPAPSPGQNAAQPPVATTTTPAREASSTPEQTPATSSPAPVPPAVATPTLSVPLSSAPTTSAADSGEVASRSRQATAEPSSGDLAREVTGPVTAGTAAAIVALLALRRRHQLIARAPGRRVLHPGSEAARFETALAHIAEPGAGQAVASTSVVAGEIDDRPFLLDLGAVPLTSVVGEPDVARDFLGGLVTSLVCADWSQQVQCVVIGAPLDWAEHFDHPLLTATPSTAGAVTRWVDTAEQRRQLESAQDDSPHEIYLFSEHLTPDELAMLSAHPHPKMSAVVIQRAPGATQVVQVSTARGTLAQGDIIFTPQLISEPARRALIELSTVTLSESTTPAPWWHHPPAGIDEPTTLPVREQFVLPADEERDPAVDESPKLMVLGPVELQGARGQEPARAVRQCLEYCGWILQNPGLSSSAMVQALLIAETTRRSNMSRLRTWLGTNSEGHPYLPEAYTGRISLQPEVSCDWEDFESLVSGGANRASSQALVDALTLVRGAPLADAAPGQWHWAEEWRSDMVSAIRDVAVELARRALDQQDLDTARWAANRALKAAPEDELLMGIKIKVAHLTGDHAEVDRLRLHLTRHARLVGIDLLEETVTLLQEVVEGQARSRRA